MWEFIHPNSKQAINYTPTQTPLISNDAEVSLQAALADEGLVWMPEYVLAQYLSTQQLIPVLTDWAITYQGYHLYYPSRNDAVIFKMLVDCLTAE